MSSDLERAALERRWLELVRIDLPSVAVERRWPVRLDHCFARILLDAVCRQPWRQRVRPPAYRNLPVPLLARAIALGEAALMGGVDLHRLNTESLVMRRRGFPATGWVQPLLSLHR